MDYINRTLNDEYNSGNIFDRVYAGNVPINEGYSGDLDTAIDYQVPGLQLREPFNDVALRTVGLGGLGEDTSTPTQSGNWFEHLFDTTVNAFSTQAIAPNVVAIKNKIKAETAQFLYLNTVLQNLMNDFSVVTTDKAIIQQLWTQQQYLEGLLPSQLVLADSMTNIDYPAVNMVTDVTNLSVFVGQMEYQISQVTELANKYKHNATLPVFGSTSTMVLIGVGLLVYLGISGKLSRVL